MVSVIIPCYNCAHVVGRAIDSVIYQDFRDWELILIDNNSTDNTLETLYKFRDKYIDKSIKVLTETKKGAPAARNKGLEVAIGSWIQFLDADDELLPSKLSHQINVADTSKCDVIVSPGKELYQKDGTLQTVVKQAISHDIWEGLIRSRLGITSANLWSREAIVKVGGWDENKSSSQEYHLLFKLLKAESVIFVDEMVLTTIHTQDNSISKSKDKGKLEGIVTNRIDLRISIGEYLKERKMLTKNRKECINLYIYKALEMNHSVIPDYVNRQFFSLSLPLRMKLKWFAKLTKDQLTKILR